MDELEAVTGNTEPCSVLLALLRNNRIIININIVDKAAYPSSWVDYRNGISDVYFLSSDDAQILFHELLHIKRQRFDCLPFIAVKAGTPREQYFDISVLGNNLHHAFILHEEFAAYPGAQQCRADEFKQTVMDLQHKPSEIVGRDGWMAGMLFMTSHLIFPEEMGVTASLRQGCISLGVDPRPLSLDREGAHSEQSLFMQFREAVHYPAHEFVSFSQFDANQTIRRL